MKKIFLTILTVLLAVTESYSQNPVAEALCKKGYENVRACQRDNKTLYLSIEDRMYRNTYKGVAEALKTVMETVHGQDVNLEIVFTEYGQPDLHIAINSSAVSSYVPGTSTMAQLADVISIDRKTDEAWRVLNKDKAKTEQKAFGKVDFVVYPQLMLSNTLTEAHLYDYSININPAIEMQLWRGAKFTAQAIFPIGRNMNGQFRKVRPGVIALSQHFDLTHGFKAAISAGNFTDNRMGLDVAALWRSPNGRIEAGANAGATVQSIVTNEEGWHISTKKRYTGNVHVSYFIAPLQSSVMLTGEHHVYGDNSLRCDLKRYFANCSFGVYAMRVNGEYNIGATGSIPLFPRRYARNKGFRIRAAHSWDMLYSMKSSFGGKAFNTQPGRNYMTSTDENSIHNFRQPDYVKTYLKKYGD